MKPTPQLVTKQQNGSGDVRAGFNGQSFPVTDYAFRTGVEKVQQRSVSTEERRSQIRSFRRLSNEFLGGESERRDIPELIGLIAMLAVSGGSILGTIIAVTRMVRGW